MKLRTGPAFALFLAQFPCVLFADGITATDLGEMKRVTSIDVSNDGKRAAYSVLSIDLDAEDEQGAYRTHLHLVDLNSELTTQLTFGDRKDRAPLLSPDGAQLAFSRSENGVTQVFVLPLDGPGEARTVTDLEHGARALAWFPDGEALLVSTSFPAAAFDGSPPWKSERPGLPHANSTDRAVSDSDGPGSGDIEELRKWLEGNANDENPHVISRLDFQAERQLASDLSFRQLYRVRLDGEQAIRLTDDWVDARSPALSPDGELVVFVADYTSELHPDRVSRNSIFGLSLTDADGPSARMILDDPGSNFSTPFFVAGGLGFVFRDSADPLFGRNVLGFLGDLQDADPIALTSTYRFGVSSPRASSTGTILFRTAWHGGISLLEIDPRSGELSDLINGPRGVEAFDEGAGQIVIAMTSPQNPGELFALDDGDLTQLTHLHTDLLAQRELSLPTEHWLERPDGTRVQYWVLEPIARTPGKSYPVVLEMHGGPQAMWGPAAYTMWHEFQVLTAAGYGVVFANPRGSSGYGEQFQRANYRDWGTGPSGDVLAALDNALDEHPWMDRERLVVTGGSYAGYLTAWIVGHDHRFKAAVAQRGVYDLVTFYGEGNAWRLVEEAFGGKPWQPETRAILARESPFTYVADVRTPLLIMHASSDLRTGVAQSEMLYKALKDLGREVEYVRYPSAGHDLSRSGRPRRRLDRLGRILEFFERFVRQGRKPTTAPDGSPTRPATR